MKSQCCQPPQGSVRCTDCPLTAPLFRTDPWPFAVAVQHRPVERQEILDRQYAHFDNPVSGLKEAA